MSSLSRREPENQEPEVVDTIFSQYLASLNQQTVTLLSKPSSSDVVELVQRSVYAILGNFPVDEERNITISREHLAGVLGSAMVDGYFLGNAEQRLLLEQAMQ